MWKALNREEEEPGNLNKGCAINQHSVAFVGQNYPATTPVME